MAAAGQTLVGKTSKEHRLWRVAEMDLLQCPRWEIARELKVSEATVCRDLAEVRERYRNATVQLRGEKVAEDEAAIKGVLRRAWVEWERSRLPACRDATREEVKEGSHGPVSTESKEHVEQGQCGNPAFLRIVLDCWESLRELHGTAAPKKVEAAVTVVPWSEIARVVEGDPIEDLIAAVELQAVTGSVNANGPVIEHKQLPSGSQGTNGSNGHS